jgi:predicted dehydrogenase
MSDSSRRSFFSKTALAAGAAAAIASGADAAKKKKEPEKPVSKYDRKLKIGVIGLGDGSFMTWSWSDIIEATKPGTPRGNFGTPFLNMEITHVWDRDKKNAQDFANRIGATVVDKYDGMLGLIDGLIMADIYDVPIQSQLIKPYLEAGVPTYVSRPFAYSLREIDSILESAAKANTPIMATAKYEHYKEVPAMQDKMKNIGNIRNVQASTFTIDFPMHFHAQFMMLKMLGYDVKQVSMFCDQDFKTNYVHEVYVYPKRDNAPPFVCTIDGSPIQDSFFVDIYGDKGKIHAEMLRGYNWEYGLLNRYAPQIIDMQRTFYGKNYEPYDIVRKKTEIFISAYYSYTERNGGLVDIGTVPADWRVKSPNLRLDVDFNNYK